MEEGEIINLFDKMLKEDEYRNRDVVLRFWEKAKKQGWKEVMDAIYALYRDCKITQDDWNLLRERFPRKKD